MGFPILLSSFKTLLWFFVLPGMSLFFLDEIDVIGKILISFLTVVFFTLLYALLLVFLMWIKFKNNELPLDELGGKTVWEKQKFVSSEISWL